MRHRTSTVRNVAHVSPVQPATTDLAVPPRPRVRGLVPDRCCPARAAMAASVVCGRRCTSVCRSLPSEMNAPQTAWGTQDRGRCCGGRERWGERAPAGPPKTRRRPRHVPAPFISTSSSSSLPPPPHTPPPTTARRPASHVRRRAQDPQEARNPACKPARPHNHSH